MWRMHFVQYAAGGGVPGALLALGPPAKRSSALLPSQSILNPISSMGAG